MELLWEADLVALGFFLLGMISTFGGLLQIRKRRTTPMLVGGLLMASSGVEVIAALALSDVSGAGFWLMLVVALLIELFGVGLTALMLRRRRLERKG